MTASSASSWRVFVAWRERTDDGQVVEVARPYDFADYATAARFARQARTARIVGLPAAALGGAVHGPIPINDGHASFVPGFFGDDEQAITRAPVLDGVAGEMLRAIRSRSREEVSG